MFYHVSKNDLGEEFTFTPRVPETAVVSKEGNIPRVCVSTEILYCLRAILSFQGITNLDVLRDFQENGVVVSPSVYTTDQEAYLPPDCSDFRDNHEHWFISDVVMYRKGYLCLENLMIGEIVVVKQQTEIILEGTEFSELELC